MTFQQNIYQRSKTAQPKGDADHLSMSETLQSEIHFDLSDSSTYPINVATGVVATHPADESMLLALEMGSKAGTPFAFLLCGRTTMCWK